MKKNLLDFFNIIQISLKYINLKLFILLLGNVRVVVLFFQIKMDWTNMLAKTKTIIVVEWHNWQRKKKKLPN